MEEQVTSATCVAYSICKGLGNAKRSCLWERFDEDKPFPEGLMAAEKLPAAAKCLAGIIMLLHQRGAASR